MRCPKCEFENPAGMKFCGKCRTSLGTTCPSCSFENPPGFDFCGQCAAALHGDITITKGKSAEAKPVAAVRVLVGEASATLEGERKTVTALFADIKGSTELMEDLDPEEARAIIDPALRIMIDAVRRYDGYVVQSTGDGIFASFGAPVAHEDHPQRAVHAAVAARDDLRHHGDDLRMRGRTRVEVRIGINTGEVVMRSVQTGGHTEYSPIGHVINVASRMQSAAPANGIVVSEDTRRRSLLCRFIVRRSVFTAKLGVVPTGNSVWRNFEDDPFWSARDGHRRDCCGRSLTGQTHRFLNSLGVLDYFAKPTNHDPAEVGERSPTSTITPTFGLRRTLTTFCALP